MAKQFLKEQSSEDLEKFYIWFNSSQNKSTKEEIKIRNTQIMKDYIAGIKNQEIALKNNTSVSYIHDIMEKMAFYYNISAKYRN
jgi:DNA-binding NarL/FixJ family response regulator